MKLTLRQLRLSIVITTTKILDRDNGEIKDVRGVCFVEIEVSFYMMNNTSKFIADFIKII